MRADYATSGVRPVRPRCGSGRDEAPAGDGLAVHAKQSAFFDDLPWLVRDPLGGHEHGAPPLRPRCLDPCTVATGAVRADQVVRSALEEKHRAPPPMGVRGLPVGEEEIGRSRSWSGSRALRAAAPMAASVAATDCGE